ncbi:uncharacterized protein LOC119668405 [Teleopsis dalmanni]|uniref:uncharacterized protein LOC119668405 n=1 Tax=Teleopsis dalmanni TaxID=139649 RepID=UPI0018CCE700|nr:uncharacterized protein LOC119668405 [Teleopsis dalmanni]
MNNSSDSGSNLQNLLESVDYSLLNECYFTQELNNTKSKHLFWGNKSHRFLCENEKDQDLMFPKYLMHFVHERLSYRIIKENEFYQGESAPLAAPKYFESDTTLLQNANNYVKTYEEFEQNIKRTIFKSSGCNDFEMNLETKFESASVNAQSILNSNDLSLWSRKRLHPRNFFRYKLNNKGTFKLIGPQNEYKDLRRRNCWNVSKISFKQKNK